MGRKRTLWDLYKHLEFETAGDRTLARVGVATPLTEIAAAFNANGVTIPHGECPRVRLRQEHVQQGGERGQALDRECPLRRCGLSLGCEHGSFAHRRQISGEACRCRRNGRWKPRRPGQFLEQAHRNITSDAPLRGFEGNRPLSFMSDAFVRREDFTPDGREFALPYKNRLNCTKRPLSASFVEAFVDLVDRVVNSKNVELVIQLFVGGGAYASPDATPPLTSICHRDITAGIVFDCFYKPDGLQDAESFQAEMEALLPMLGDQEVRMLWGSFGDTNIANENVRKCYYDDETWRDLQELKKQVDGDDLFHTEFTVQLPT